MHLVATNTVQSQGWSEYFWSAAADVGATLTGFFAEKPVCVADHVIPYLKERTSVESKKSTLSFFQKSNGERMVEKVLLQGNKQRESAAFKLCKGLPHVVQGEASTKNDVTTISMKETGMDLFELMLSLGHGQNTRPLPKDLFKSISQQFLKGLDAMHKKGLIHNDIKPENVTIDEQSYVSIIDLGETMTTNDAKSCPEYTSTAGYIAPELFQEGDERKVEPSQATDIFAAGITLYELLTGLNFIHFESPEATMKANKAICKNKESLEKYKNDQLGFGIEVEVEKHEKLLRKMLAWNPEERPTAEQVLDELKKLN